MAALQVMRQLRLPEFVDVPGMKVPTEGAVDPRTVTVSIAEPNKIPRRGERDNKAEGMEEMNDENIKPRVEEKMEETVDEASPLAAQEQHKRQTTDNEKRSRKGNYAAFKQMRLLQCRRAIKNQTVELALKGWIRNVGDDCFVL